jgi:rod shape-determining protein MreC
MLLLISVTALALDYRGEASRAITHVRHGFDQAISPFQRAAQAALHPVGDVASAAFHYGSLQTENAKLRDENGILQQQLYANAYASKVAAALSALDNLPFVGNLPTVAAQVTDRSTSNFEPTIELDQGWSSGVGDGMPVVGESGLVGTVISASESTATVLLLQDTRQAVGVEDPSGHQYILSGAGADHALTLKSSATESVPVRVGAVVTTTGQTNNNPAALYPAGIPVGVVVTSSAQPGGVATGTVRPFVDTDTLDYVRVIEWLPSA